MTLHRAGAPDLQLRMHYDVCALGAYVASPSGVSQVTQRLLAAVFHPLAQGYGFSNPLPKG
jgi:hypothetical protein